VDAVYAGTFDPLTYGHLDVIERGAKICDRLVVAVSESRNKYPTFPLGKRIEMVQEATKHIPNVEVEGFSGLLVEYLRKKSIKVVIRGLRALSDFEYEFQLALMNKKLDPEVETIFLVTRADRSFVSSKIVKEIFSYGGSVSDLVPDVVVRYMKEHFSKDR